MSNEKIQILMDKYGMGLLTDLEKDEVNKIMEEDSNLKKEFLIRKEISDSINYLGDNELRGFLKKIKKEEIDSKGYKRRIIWSLLMGIFIFILLASYFSNSESSKTPTELFASYYTPYNPSLQTRDIKNSVYLDDFARYYQQGNYEEALDIISPHLSTNNNSILLASAIAALESDQSELSHQLLDQIILEGNKYFLYHAYWYKSMLYLKDSKLDLVESQLINIVKDPKADHFKEAKKLLRQL